ncbi:fumarate hydratase [Tepiditoga spiralis]|uniref:Fumarate hydratase n=1 Tax=Tepiditoga spiralis TaxID=2108365 RepID=A0A7G1G854_9BACT|nr:FumA C-terminus/TtdB family hydratase beta subunit [Tepiditoga spiralis]BBE30202.1 fumarate hydratase [Tepiditoga spiralis]
MNIESLKIWDEISYSGELIVMRDAAHKRLKELMDDNKKLPVDLNKKIIFYAGPAKSLDGFPVGSIGPTTSNRMDPFLDMVFSLGVLGTIGKGKRSSVAISMCKKYKRVYFVTPSGSAAVMAKKVIKRKVLAFNDLGTEAIQLLEVVDFPLLVAIDSNGNSIFK